MKRIPTVDYLTRRENEIMDVLYKFGKATAADVRDKLSEKRSYSTVRAQLRVLEQKRHVYHETQKLGRLSNLVGKSTSKLVSR